MIDETEIRVAGIPALACDIEYDAGESACYMEGCQAPGYDSEVEFTVCDRRGRAAPWLQRKLDADRKLADDVYRQVMSAVEYDIEESSY